MTTRKLSSAAALLGSRGGRAGTEAQASARRRNAVLGTAAPIEFTRPDGWRATVRREGRTEWAAAETPPRRDAPAIVTTFARRRDAVTHLEARGYDRVESRP